LKKIFRGKMRKGLKKKFKKRAFMKLLE